MSKIQNQQVNKIHQSDNINNINSILRVRNKINLCQLLTMQYHYQANPETKIGLSCTSVEALVGSLIK